MILQQHPCVEYKKPESLFRQRGCCQGIFDFRITKTAGPRVSMPVWLPFPKDPRRPEPERDGPDWAAMKNNNHSSFAFFCMREESVFLPSLSPAWSEQKLLIRYLKKWYP